MTPSEFPFERPNTLADALREQGATPDEVAALEPTLRRLGEWQAPRPSAADTQRLLSQLVDALPALAPTPALSPSPTLSPIRQCIRAERRRQGYGLRWLLAVARTQVSLFGMGFWLVSALITVAGVIVTLSLQESSVHQATPMQVLLLRACGPLLAYLGATVAFRGMGERTLECELACPASPLQLTIARLVIILGYDVGLGLVLTLAMWADGAGQVLALTLAWFMPLLLVAGLALALAQRFSIQTAAFAAYGGWLAFLAIGSNVAQIASWPFVLTALSDAVIGVVGVALLAIALWRLRANLHHMLPAL
jgi:hypothetical protein